MTTIFLTGATGLLGHYTAAQLLARQDVRLRLLVSPPLDKSRERLRQLLAELGVDLNADAIRDRIDFVAGRLPDDVSADDLCDVDVVVHAAASTRFHSNKDGEPNRTNVLGTVRLLDLVAKAGVPDFILVSTAFAGGVTGTALAEAPLGECAPNANDYETSKWLAENAVLAWGAIRRRVAIMRLPILIGDVATGRATTFGGIYVLARAVELLAQAAERDPNLDRHHIPLRIMGRPEAPLNVAPVCWASRRLADIVLCDAVAPPVVNLVNPHPPTTFEIKSWLESIFDLAGGVFTDRIWPWTDATPLEEVFYSAGDPVHAYFHRAISFETNYLSAIGETRPLVDRSHFDRCMQYAIKNRWGRRRNSTAQNMGVSGQTFEPAWYFESFMRSRLPHSTVSRIEGLSAVVRYVIADLENGEWVCRYEGGRLTELHRGPNTLVEDFGFRVERRVFESIVTGRRSLQSAYYDGHAEMFGDTLKAMKMVPIMDAFLREHVVAPRQLQVHNAP